MKTLRLSFLFLFALALLGRADAAAIALPRATPESQGISSTAIQGFVDGAESKVHALHSFMLIRHGQVVAEGWWAPFAADEPHQMFSLSKSFTSTAIGLAIADGKLSLDDPILKFFPDEAPAEPSEYLRAMRVRDLLRMLSGQHADAIKDFPFGSKQDLVKLFLSLPVSHKPGTIFVYNTPGSYILSAIVQKVTGQTELDYLRPRIFDPLGIENPTWDKSAQGICYGGFGLNLRTEDIARFGLLYLHKGEWQGRQLVPTAWVEAATSLQTANGSEPSSDWDQGYGYQFWRCRHGFFRGDGAFGQFCIVMPQYDAVFAATSGTRDMQSVMNLVWDRIVPAFRDAPLPEDAAAQHALHVKLSSLVLEAPMGAASSPTAKTVAGRKYVFTENPQNLEWLSLDPPQPDGTQGFTVKLAWEPEQHLVASPGVWRKGTLLDGTKSAPVAARGVWSTPDTYSLAISRYLTPFVTTWHLTFAGDDLTLVSEQNVGNGDAIKPVTILAQAAK